jgi:hypothetical protein
MISQYHGLRSQGAATGRRGMRTLRQLAAAIGLSDQQERLLHDLKRKLESRSLVDA